MNSMAKNFVVFACAFAAVFAPAAAQVVSYAYDGAYYGAALPEPGLSHAGCAPLPLTEIDIRNGALRAWDGDRQTVKGIVTGSGFFNADYYFPGRAGVVFEGVIDAGGRLSGGIMDGGCAWVVDLVKWR